MTNQEKINKLVDERALKVKEKQTLKTQSDSIKDDIKSKKGLDEAKDLINDQKEIAKKIGVVQDRITEIDSEISRLELGL
jgi:predicted nuclease with TOPRIM domain